MAKVEAMSAGAVPVAIGRAGQLEVFDNGVEGYHFDSLEQLVRHTETLVANPARRERMSEAAIARAALYNDATFRQLLLDLVEQLVAPPAGPVAPVA